MVVWRYGFEIFLYFDLICRWRFRGGRKEGSIIGRRAFMHADEWLVGCMDTRMGRTGNYVMA